MLHNPETGITYATNSGISLAESWKPIQRLHQRNPNTINIPEKEVNGMENMFHSPKTGITVDTDKQLQILDRAITYATNSGISLDESWKTINELLTPKITLTNPKCKTVHVMNVPGGYIDIPCALSDSHIGPHQTNTGWKFQ